MPPDERDLACLLDMLQAARAAYAYTQHQTKESYLSNEMLRDAVERRVELIGEAARGVSQAMRDQHPQILWRQIIAQRNVLVHDYGEVDHDVLWHLVTFHVPVLIRELQDLIPPPPAAE